MTSLLDIEAVDRDVVRQARADLATAFRAAALYGYTEGIDNHLSLAVPGRDDLFLINRYGDMFDEMTASSLIKMDLDGNVIGTPGKFNSAGFTIHSGI